MDHHVVERQHRTLFRHALQDVELATGGLRVEVGLEDVVRIAVNEPDVADGELLDVRRCVERRPIRLRFLDERGCFVPVLRIGVVRRITEVLERGGIQLARAVEHGDASLHFLEILRIEYDRPRIGGQAELLHLLVVVADDRCRHRVRHRILVTRIERRIEIGRINILQVGKLRLVDRLQLSSANQRLHGVGRRHEDVVALGAGGELGQKLLVVRVVRLHDLALALLLEALDRFRRDVVVPVVEVELIRGRRGRGRQREGQDGGESSGGLLHDGVLVGAKEVGGKLRRDDDQHQRQQHQQR